MFPQRIPKESKPEKSLLFSEKEPQLSVVSFFFKKERTRAEFVATPRGCSSVGRAPALQAGGQEFESLHLHESRLSRKRQNLLELKSEKPKKACFFRRGVMTKRQRVRRKENEQKRSP